MPTKKEVKEAVRAAQLAEARAREAKAVRELKKHEHAMAEGAKFNEQEAITIPDSELNPKTEGSKSKSPQRH